MAHSRFANHNGKENLTFSLCEGRILSFAEYGHPAGYPVFLFHGFPSSRMEAFPWDRVALRRGIRIIAPDRPGFGLSTPQAHRRILDWPNDVAALADRLNISRFAVLGCSGGGPYALACAYVLPHKMISGVGLFAGAPPWTAGSHYMPWFTRFAAWTATHTPRLFEVATNVVMGALQWLMRTKLFTRLIDLVLEQRREKESEQDKGAGLGEHGELTIEESRERMLSVLFEGFSQGSSAFVHETTLLFNADWGFRFEDVDYEPIKMWHGAKDKNAPIEPMRYLADHLPYAELTEFSSDTHFTMAKYMSRVLDELVSEEEREKFAKTL